MKVNVRAGFTSACDGNTANNTPIVLDSTIGVMLNLTTLVLVLIFVFFTKKSVVSKFTHFVNFFLFNPTLLMQSTNIRFKDINTLY